MKSIFRFLSIIVVGLGIFFYQNGLPKDLPFVHQGGQAIQTQSDASNQKVLGESLKSKEVTQTEPLKVSTELIAGDKNSAELTIDGVINFTNLERSKGSLVSLTLNEKLNASAKAKTEDMFRKQYFEHTSPDGITISDLAKEAGYEFILIGENLAYGDFKDDQALVTAWMNSPKHRANIMNDEYTEIGVAVGHGLINGVDTWLAVQHFGRPASLCPEVDKTLKADIDQNKTRIDQITQDLNLIDGGAAVFVAYFKDFKEVTEYNKLVKETKIKIDSYNEQVTQFNLCIQE